MLNVNEPIEGEKRFWQIIIKMHYVKEGSVIIVGDINLTFNTLCLMWMDLMKMRRDLANDCSYVGCNRG